MSHIISLYLACLLTKPSYAPISLKLPTTWHTCWANSIKQATQDIVHATAQCFSSCFVVISSVEVLSKKGVLIDGNRLSAEILLPLVRASMWILLVLVRWSPLNSSHCVLVLTLVWWLVAGSWHVLSWSFITTQIVSLPLHVVSTERQAWFILTSLHLECWEAVRDEPRRPSLSAAFLKRRARSVFALCWVRLCSRSTFPHKIDVS